MNDAYAEWLVKRKTPAIWPEFQCLFKDVAFLQNATDPSNYLFRYYFPRTSAASFISSMIGRCCGHTLSHCPHAMQSEAFPLLLIRPE